MPVGLARVRPERLRQSHSSRDMLCDGQKFGPSKRSLVVSRYLLEAAGLKAGSTRRYS